MPMNPFFALLSVGYIAGIFLLVKFPAKFELLHKLNPYSLAHIPLYGVLTMLLILTFRPRSVRWQRILFPFIIAFSIAILDEFNQASIPERQASVGDVFLDLIGIMMVSIIMIILLARTPIRHRRES